MPMVVRLEQLGLQALLNGAADAGQLLARRVRRDLTHERDIRLVDIDDKVLLRVGVHALQQLHDGHVRTADPPDADRPRAAAPSGNAAPSRGYRCRPERMLSVMMFLTKVPLSCFSS